MAGKKVAIVTGSNKGIGLAIVRALCKQFDGTVYLTSRDEKRGLDAVKLLNSEGLHPEYHQLDITSTDSIEKLKSSIQDKYGGIDILVNNAAIAFKQKDPAPFAEQAEVTMKCNFTAMLNINRRLLPIVKSHGRVVNVASFAGSSVISKMTPSLQKEIRDENLTEEKLVKFLDTFVKLAKEGKHEAKGYPSQAYSISKAGVIALTRLLAKEIEQDSSREDILINSCCPGWVDTDMSSHKGSKTPDQGAITPVFCALLPQGSKSPQGKFLSDKQVKNW